MSDNKTLVCGAGGFIGGHLVKSLLKKGQSVRAVDIKPFHKWFQYFPEAENLCLDLRKWDSCRYAVKGMDDVYNLAADMGGMGFIEKHKADCMLSVLINTHLLIAARMYQVQRYFYASSACVYAASKQCDYNVIPLKESDAYPAMPEDGYGWEKLFSERMCRHFTEDFGLETWIARFHNVYGPHGTWQGGREKAPAAICRKVINAKLTNRHQIEIWGDGQQTRSFMFIGDCIDGIHRILDEKSLVAEPVNLGSSELVSINQLVSIVEQIAGVELRRTYDLEAPKGVNGRNSDNSFIQERLRWQPLTKLRDGMQATYQWIYDQMVSRI